MSIATAINKNRCIYFGLEPRRISTTRRFADDPFLARFGHQLPRGLRQEARGLQWRTFAATYSPAPDLRLQFLSEEKLPGGVVHYTAAIKTRSGETHHDIIASGPVQAATQLLATAGRRVEICSFHQYDVFEATVTFIRVCHNKDERWAMGFGGTRSQSAAAALSNAAFLLHT